MSYRIVPPQTKKQSGVLAERSSRLRKARLSVLANLDCLHGVPTDELEHLVELCSFRVFMAGETIIHERKPNRYFYLVLQGSMCLMIHGKEGQEVLLDVLDRGDCCGEGPLFSDFFCRAGAQAITPCYLLQLPIVSVRSLLSHCPTLNEALRRFHLRRLVEGTLAHGPLFSQILPLERVTLATLLEPRHYPRNTTIVHQGKEGSALYVVEAGQVIVERNGQMIAFLEEGDFFGEMALIAHQPHSASVRALTPIDLLILSAKSFQHILTQRPDLEIKLQTVVRQRRAADREKQNNENQSRWLRTLVEHGVLRGHRLLARIPPMCPPGCRLCEHACVRRHGHLRLHLNGLAVDEYDIPDACRQCRVGAECTEACPEDAFEWRDFGMLVITDRCTGCGECIPACPYNRAIALVPRARRRWGVVGKLLKKARHLAQPRPLIIEDESPYTHRADKCDLCADYDDLACLTACPTGSLRLLPIDNIRPT
jgi:CRP-like cAMP-binding protein/Fe-S-cluster-containing hydrogenase component 2